MRGRGRDLSLREQRLIDSFIGDICNVLHISTKNGDLYQCAWAAFLSVYRDNPSAFSGSGLRGWRRAYLIIWDALVQARRENGLWRYGRASLDEPVNSEIRTPRLELLPSRCGDFQNSVCFHDYLQHLEQDACRMAYCLINGDTVEEAGAYYNWSRDRTDSIYCSLRTEIERYLSL